MLHATPIDPSTERSSFGSNDPSERSEGSHRTHEPDLAACDAGLLEMSPALRRHHSKMEAAAPTPAVAKYPRTGRGSRPVQCGICKSELEGEGLHRNEGREALGSYCSPTCLSAAEALVALQLWSVKLEASGRRTEAEATTTLADDLLLLWRRRTGPEPDRVSAAVELVRSRDDRK
jgi:hypothetical protein